MGSPQLIKGVDLINFACSDMERTLEFWEWIEVKRRVNLHLHDAERNHFFLAAGRVHARVRLHTRTGPAALG
jgi:hypothetical protein